MCGICGIYRWNGPGDDRSHVEAMGRRLRKRGPDDTGLVQDGPATLGHRRLSILDLSPSGHQPMESADGRYLISFNGEIYNFAELRDELRLTPAQLRSRTDTEVLLHAWMRWGPETLPHLVGQWAFALYDRQERCLWLSRDRFGEKPLFYHQSSERLCFASNIAALLQAPGVGREIDPDALLEMVAMRYVVAPRTILAGIRKLPGGHLMRVDASGVTIVRWYDLPVPDKRRPRRHEEVLAEFDRVFKQACRRCLVSDVPVAMFLSDGIDSNAIHHALLELGDDIPCYTFNTEENRSDCEVEGLSASNITPLRVGVTQRMREMLPAFEALNEPTGDGVALATWQLVRNARPHATVFLCGHGGDEIMGGYRMNRDLLRLQILHRLAYFPGPWGDALYQKYVNGGKTAGIKRRRLRGIPSTEIPRAARYMIHRPLAASSLAEIFGHEVDADLSVTAVDRLYESCNERSGMLDRMQDVMLQTFLPENLLSFADAASMDSSAELRMPFLDRDLVKLVLELPESFRASPRPGGSHTKVLLREWSRGRLSTKVVRRRKRGFASGSIAGLLEHDGPSVRSHILDVPQLREQMPGLETWLSHEPRYFRAEREGTLWAILALAIWYAAQLPL